jgi:hypothetical protein
MDGDPPKAPEDTEATLRWRIREEAGLTTVEFAGEVDENADFAKLGERLAGAVVFDLAEVRRLNSCGVREWVNFVRDLPRVTELTFARCSPAVVGHLNVISNFRGPAKVRSFLAPYVCERCHREEEKLLSVEQDFASRDLSRVPELRCAGCGAPMEFGDVPGRYLLFLADP